MSLKDLILGKSEPSRVDQVPTMQPFQEELLKQIVAMLSNSIPQMAQRRDVGHARNLAIGDQLSNLMRSCIKG